MQKTQIVAFELELKSIYHILFWMLLVVLSVSFLVLFFIGFKIGWREVLHQINQTIYLILTLFCVLFYWLDRKHTPWKKIGFRDERLYYWARKDGIVYDFPIKEIQVLHLSVGGRRNFLEVKFNNKYYHIKLYNIWIWKIWRLEKKINSIAKYYSIHRV